MSGVIFVHSVVKEYCIEDVSSQLSCNQFVGQRIRFYLILLLLPI